MQKKSLSLGGCFPLQQLADIWVGAVNFCGGLLTGGIALYSLNIKHLGGCAVTFEFLIACVVIETEVKLQTTFSVHLNEWPTLTSSVIDKIKNTLL